MRNAIILVLVTAAFVLGVAGFMTIETQGGKMEPQAAVYHALGLFVLNPGPLGLPAGGPPHSVIMLWVAFFLAPLSLATFLFDAVLSVMKSRERSYRGREGHTIVCGLGRTALLAVDEIVDNSSPRDVVVVELFPECPQLPGVRERGVPVVMGSMEEESVLRKAGVEGARRILAFSHNDILNINTVALARSINRSKEFRAAALVTDARLMENLPESLKKSITFLNTYAIAANALVTEKRLTHGYEDAYVVAGFGNFGQMMLKALLDDDANAKGDRFFVVDREAARKVRQFHETYGFDGFDIRPVQGDLYDPELWKNLLADLKKGKEDGPHRDPIVLVCTDNDVLNLSLALSIRKHYVKQSMIYCRVFGELSFEAEMVKGHRIEVYRVAELLRKHLPADVLSTR